MTTDYTGNTTNDTTFKKKWFSIRKSKMLKIIITFFFSLVFYSSFSQNASNNYDEAIAYYNSEDYKKALQYFQLAKKVYQDNNTPLGIINCLAYMSSIHSMQGDYSTSVITNNEALTYFKDRGISNDSLYTELLSNKALSLKFLGKFKEAYATNNLLIKYLDFEKDRKKYLAGAYQIRSRIEIDLGTYDNAIASAKKALVLNPEQNQERKSELLNIIGVGYYFKDQLDSTSYYYNASFKIKQKIKAHNYQLAITTYNIGIVQEDLGNYDKAIEFYNKAVVYDLLDRGEAIGFLSDIYVALTNTYFKKNDLEKAEEFAEKALQIAKKKYGEESPNISFVYIAYSNIFELKGDYKKNIEYIQKALNIRRKTYGNNHRWTAESLLSIAEGQIQLKQYAKAEKNYNEAIDIAKSINNNLVNAYAELGLGTIYMETNKHTLASQFLKASKTRFIKSYGNYHDTHLGVLVIEAENYFKQEQPQKALQIIEDIKANATNSKLFYHLDALTLQLEMALHDFNTYNKTTLLEKSIHEIDEAIKLITNIKKDYPTSKSKIYVNNSMNVFISKAIEGSYILYSKTKKRDYLESAFKLSELNRSSALVSGIQNVRFKKMANVPEVLLEKENKLNHELASLKKEVYYEEGEETPDTEYLNELWSKQLNCRKMLDSLLTKMEIQHPKYYQLKYSENGIDVKTLQASIIKDNQTVVEYFLADNYVYAFTITKSQIEFKRLAASKKTKAAIVEFRTQLSKQQDLAIASKILYKLLLEDLNLKTSHLIVIPDKELNHLPFEALINKDGYLIENYTISYSGSSSLLATQQDDFFNFKFDSNWSGFAPTYKTNTTLTSNQDEITTIAKLMKGDAFLGDQASIDNFKIQAQNSSILHLATHAQVDHNNPLYNQLIFSKDAVLTASDIYTLAINADLTVLSACETGFGKLEKSEGVMSMSRAFQYAGVKSTMMSLWKIPDQETSKLMASFYTYLKKGFSKDKALQKAKLEYLKTTDDIALKHPYYWSGFIISGDIAPLENTSKLWIILLILIAIVVTYIGRKRLVNLFK